jgi:hypothetical protein
MEKTICARCGDGGGRMIFRGDKYYHVNRCTASTKHRDSAKSTFPFTTTQIAGPGQAPIEVKSMRHLRQLESSYGVSSDVYNNDRSNRTPWERN